MVNIIQTRLLTHSKQGVGIDMANNRLRLNDLGYLSTDEVEG